MSKQEPTAKLTRSEAGRLGGLRTKQRHGTDHYRRIGVAGGGKGGSATLERHGVEHFRRIGALGGSRGAGRKRAAQ